jgi:FdrA protein
VLTDHLVLVNEYRDSVSLMQIAARLRAVEGIEDAAVVMMTPANLALLDDVGLSVASTDARPSDLLIVAVGRDRESVDAALETGRSALSERSDTTPRGDVEDEPSRSIVMAASRLGGADLVVISTPGEFAPYEAEKSLRLGANVMLFSDGIDVEEERRLKLLADERGLLVMGPDCGTAIVNGVPLGFANEVRRGSIGIVGAAGTGIQAVICAIDNLGGGVSHAIGTGGHDLHERVGGISMLRGITLLGEDEQTEVIVLVSKPPEPATADRVVRAAVRTGKQVVVCFLGASTTDLPAEVHRADTLEAAAELAVGLVGGTGVATHQGEPPLVAFAPSQQYLRGLYSGGTLCFEATMILGAMFDAVSSNTPIGAAKRLDDPWRSSGHTLVDLGDDVFTRGRPHPMIDHTIRNERLLAEARDPETAVVLLDVVLGHGSHPDPASAMASTIAEARGIAAAAGRDLPIVATVVGTQGDPQGLTGQLEALRGHGVHAETTHGAALRTVAQLLNLAEEDDR